MALSAMILMVVKVVNHAWCVAAIITIIKVVQVHTLVTTTPIKAREEHGNCDEM